jgi:homocysteine S-methyltransferase
MRIEIFFFFHLTTSELLIYNLQACVELLEEENIEVPSWICFSSVDGENAPSGESFKECLDIINKSNKVHAVGINCAPPQFIETLICKFKKVIPTLYAN